MTERELSGKQIEIAQQMLWQLENQQLRVALVPAWGHYGDEGKLLRVATQQNPRWYRDFCSHYPSNRSRPRKRRHADTRIKRQSTLSSLKRMIETGTCKTDYDHRLLDEIEVIAAHLGCMKLSDQEVFWYG